jgi:polyribonucleotide nucleotidyltransferase
MKIPVNKIKDVIGKGGATIKSLVGNTDITIDIDDNGDLKLFSSDDVKAQEIIAKINTIIEDVEVGKVYEGKVMKIVDFGAFVSILNGKEGLLHISQIKNERVEKVSDVLSEGQIVNVKVTEFERGKFKLTMKELNN